MPQGLTVEAVNGLLPLSTTNRPVNALKLVTKVLQEVFQNVQQFGHLHNTIASKFNRIVSHIGNLVYNMAQ